MEIDNALVKREIFIAAGCFVAAFITNVVAIILYKGVWVEAFSQIGYVLVIAAVLYAALLAVRLVIWLISYSVRRIRRPR